MSWFERRRRRWPSIFDEFFSESWPDFEQLDRMIREMLEDIFREFPEKPTYEREIPGKGVIRQWGPYVYGFSMTIGPDGKPIIREFGNVKPTYRGAEVTEVREPLVDIREEDDKLRVYVELPGVEKENIKVDATEKTVTVKVDTPERKYYKEIELPREVIPEAAEAKYKNGILQLTFKKKEDEKAKGVKINIE